MRDGVSPYIVRCCCVCIALGGSWVGAHAAQGGAVFSIDDTPGEIHLSDRPDAPVGVTVTRLVAPTRAAQAAPLAWDDIVLAAATDNGLDPALIQAVISVESAGRTNAVSPRGAAGLMQLMPPTARALGVTDPFDPRQNIEAGARHLRGLLDPYNAGSAAIERWPANERRWPSAETVAYVPRVLERDAALRTASTTSPNPSIPSP